jgi:predicted transcriptional regulator
MNRKDNLNIFNSTNTLKILNFLAINPGKEFLGSEIRQATALSRGGVYISLRELIKQKLVNRTQKGKFNVYSVAHNNPIIKVILNGQRFKSIIRCFTVPGLCFTSKIYANAVIIA